MFLLAIPALIPPILHSTVPFDSSNPATQHCYSATRPAFVNAFQKHSGLTADDQQSVAQFIRRPSTDAICPARLGRRARKRREGRRTRNNRSSALFTLRPRCTQYYIRHQLRFSRHRNKVSADDVSRLRTSGCARMPMLPSHTWRFGRVPPPLVACRR